MVKLRDINCSSPVFFERLYLLIYLLTYRQHAALTACVSVLLRVTAPTDLSGGAGHQQTCLEVRDTNRPVWRYGSPTDLSGGAGHQQTCLEVRVTHRQTCLEVRVTNRQTCLEVRVTNRPVWRYGSPTDLSGGTGHQQTDLSGGTGHQQTDLSGGTGHQQTCLEVRVCRDEQVGTRERQCMQL